MLVPDYWPRRGGSVELIGKFGVTALLPLTVAAWNY